MVCGGLYLSKSEDQLLSPDNLLAEKSADTHYGKMSVIPPLTVALQIMGNLSLKGS